MNLTEACVDIYCPTNSNSHFLVYVRLTYIDVDGDRAFTLPKRLSVN